MEKLIQLEIRDLIFKRRLNLNNEVIRKINKKTALDLFIIFLFLVASLNIYKFFSPRLESLYRLKYILYNFIKNTHTQFM